jgi:hypothetical protein
MSNLTVTYKRGAVGKELEFNNLSDQNGLVTLTPYTLTVNVEETDGTVVVDDAAVSKRDQSTRQGDCYHTLDATTANIAVGTYRAEIKATNGANVDYWPTDIDQKRRYITWIVQDPLG